MKIATWNVNGIRARESQLIEWMAQEQADVVCLQEIKATPLQVPPSVSELPGYWSHWHGLSAYSGVALLCKQSAFPEKPEFTHPHFDFETRVVTARLGDLNISSVYVPNGGKDFAAKLKFLDEMDRYVAESLDAGMQLILCGDMNIARADIDVHPKERKSKAIGQLPEERERFERMLNRGMVDVARKLHPTDEQMFTWWPPWRNMRQRNIGWRIDLLLASAPLASRLQDYAVRASIGTSDHAPIVATFA